MTNPKTAIDAILTDESVSSNSNITIYPITLARYALLELIDSPFIFANQKFTLTNMIPSFYITCASIDKLKGIKSANIDRLKTDAMEWADGLSQELVNELIPAIIDGLGLINKASPKSGGEQTKKEV